MANLFTLRALMALATKIGANPSKFMGTRTNISFLGKGPTKNPLFQRPLAGLENASVQNLGKPETLVNAVEDAMSFASAGKLNTIQKEILGKNLSGIERILHPPVLPTLPTATVTKLPTRGSGIKSVLPKEGKVQEVFFGNPKDPRFYRPPETGTAGVTAALDQKTGMSRAIARNLLLKDTRLKLKPEELFMLKEGKGEPLDLMQKYYGRSMSAYDDFLNQVNLEVATPAEFADMVLKHIKLTPQFAEGGLARILEI